MATTTKKELAQRIADETGLPLADVTKAMQAFMDQIIEDLASGKRIEFREFGVFETRRRKARLARNPKTGEKVSIGARQIVAFKPGLVMKRRVQEAIGWMQS